MTANFTLCFLLCAKISIFLVTFDLFSQQALHTIDKTFKNLQETGMSIWTKFDLVRAINTTVHDREYFLYELEDEIVFFTQTFLSLDFALCQEQALFIIELINVLVQSLQEIFQESQSIMFKKYYTLLCTTQAIIKKDYGTGDFS